MAATTPVKKVAKKVAEHPPVAEMVKTALKELKDRKGSSLAAIKKHIVANNKVADISKLAPFIKKFLKKAVEDGKVLQVKGTGASGSFKINKEKEEKPKKPTVPKKKTETKKQEKKTVASKKKAATPKKKTATDKKAVSAKKAAKPKAVKPKAEKKTAKPKTEKKAAKPKTAKPKKPVVKKTAKKPAAKQ